MCLGALGSQTGGSITRPASYCGVAGCKPSYGLVACNGVVPLAPSMDHPGPIARCVQDLAIMLQAMVDTKSGWIREDLCADYLQAATDIFPISLYRTAHGLFHDAAETSVQRAMDEIYITLRGDGGALQEISLPPAFVDVIARHRI